MPETAPRLPQIGAALGGLLLLVGCASSASDNSALGDAARPAPWGGQVTIASEPAGARCAVTNAGAPVATIASTPAPVVLPRGTSVLEVACSAPGRADTTAALRPGRDFAVHHPMPVGTGTIQNAVAVRTGSTRRYFDTTVHLPPASFASAAERDAWFAARADALRAAAAPAIARAERAPLSTIDDGAAERAYLDADLARLDQQRLAAGVTTAPAAPARAGRR
ncbi:MAG: hypothetical protein V4653_20885 [Pseudomonadota bacterium]